MPFFSWGYLVVRQRAYIALTDTSVAPILQMGKNSAVVLPIELLGTMTSSFANRIGCGLGSRSFAVGTDFTSPVKSPLSRTTPFRTQGNEESDLGLRGESLTGFEVNYLSRRRLVKIGFRNEM